MDKKDYSKENGHKYILRNECIIQKFSFSQISNYKCILKWEIKADEMAQ